METGQDELKKDEVAKKSELGYASIVAAACSILFLLTSWVLLSLFGRVADGIPGLVVAILAQLGCCFVVVGLLLGLAGLFQTNRDTTLARRGIAISMLPIFMVVCLFILIMVSSSGK